MGGIPRNTRIPEPVNTDYSSEFSQADQYNLSYSSASPIIEGFNSYVNPSAYKDASFVPQQRNQSYSLLRFIHKDGNISYYESFLFENTLSKEYGNSIIDVQELDSIRILFNEMVHYDKGRNGLLLHRDDKKDDEASDEVNEKRTKYDNKKRTDVKTILSPPFLHAKKEARDLLSVLLDNNPIYLNSKQGISSSEAIMSYDTRVLSKEEQLIKKNEYAYNKYNSFMAPLRNSIYDSYVSLFFRLGEELSSMREDFQKYKSSFGSIFEVLSMSGDMDDEEMDHLITSLSSDLDDVYYSIVKFDEQYDSYQDYLRCNAETVQLIDKLRSTRYELNRILVADDSKWEHSMIMLGWEVLGTLFGAYIATKSGPGAIPILMGSGGLVMGTGRMFHQSADFESYQSLGLDYDHEIFNNKEVAISSITGTLFGLLGPALSAIKRFPPVNSFLAKLVSVGIPQIQKYFPTFNLGIKKVASLFRGKQANLESKVLGKPSPSVGSITTEKEFGNAVSSSATKEVSEDSILIRLSEIMKEKGGAGTTIKPVSATEVRNASNKVIDDMVAAPTVAERQAIFNKYQAEIPSTISKLKDQESLLRAEIRQIENQIRDIEQKSMAITDKDLVERFGFKGNIHEYSLREEVKTSQSIVDFYKAEMLKDSAMKDAYLPLLQKAEAELSASEMKLAQWPAELEKLITKKPMLEARLELQTVDLRAYETLVDEAVKAENRAILLAPAIINEGNPSVLSYMFRYGMQDLALNSDLASDNIMKNLVGLFIKDFVGFSKKIGGGLFMGRMKHTEIDDLEAFDKEQ